MKDIHPLIEHTPADSGNVSIPALRVLSEITTSLSSDSNVEQLLFVNEVCVVTMTCLYRNDLKHATI